MKTTSSAPTSTHSFLSRLVPAMLLLGSLLTAEAALTPFGNEFTYQGRLNDASGPASGRYDFRFALQDAASGGTPIVTVTNANVAVSNGLFTTQINFGANIFIGYALWLDISVRSNGTASAFTPLSPRQPITPTPNAHYATAAARLTGTLPAANLPGNVALLDRTQTFTATQTFQTRAIFNERLGVGTPLPQAPLHVAGNYLRVDGAGGEQAVLGGDGAGGDVELGSANPAVNTVALYNQIAGDYMNLFAKAGNFSGLISGNGSGLTGLSAAQLAGTVPDARLSANVALRAGGNNFTGNQTISSGDLFFSDPNASIIFPATGGANSPMIYMFTGGTANADRMVIAHSPTFSDWGLQYQDSPDRFNFLGAGDPVMTVMLGAGGRVGIGTSLPQLQLDVAGNQGVGRFTSTNNGNGAVLILRNLTASPTYIGAINFDDGSGTPGQIGYFASHRLGFRVSGGEQMSLDAGGNLAYGGQLNKLDVADNFTAVVRAADFTMGHSSRRGSPGRALVDFTDTLFLNFASDWTHTFIGGDNVSVCSLTVRGGCDIAEPFQMSRSEEEIPKGAVVVIDEENPGHLKMSDRACDQRVAGIVSGANGVNTGVKLTQEGVFENGQNVALSGRVYVQADAGNGSIVPGDLLTTSDVPGHAMKVTDHTKAQGAILGKAMTGLKAGRGFVLVLVSLQ